MTNGSLMKVESIAECSLWSILQYFWPTLRDNQSWKPFFGLFESGRFTQVLLYQVLMGMLKIEGKGRGFQHLLRDLENINALKNLLFT